ncbi:MAG: hypothetical protein LH481_15565 [Burkholderiales bacterium]|nr:hypothetical protein [Burkholderiales bacterium]
MAVVITSHRRYFLVAAIVSALLAFYCASGALQAAMLFTGVKALRNWSLWTSLALVFASATIACACAFLPVRAPGTWASRLFAALSLFLGVASAWSVATYEAAADRCLDSGGSFNYVEAACDHFASQPYISFLARNGLGLTTTILFVSVAVWFIHLSRRTAKSGDRVRSNMALHTDALARARELDH